MSIKSEVLAGVATLTLVRGVGAAGALAREPHRRPPRPVARVYQPVQPPARHSPSPNYTVDVLRQGEKAGQPIILFRHANFDPALDWTVLVPGPVSDLFTAGLVSSRCAALRLPPRWSASRPALQIAVRGFEPAFETSTRRSAWTPACAWAWPRPRSG